MENKQNLYVADVINTTTNRIAIKNNFAINESSQYIWQLNEHDAEILNEGFKNGKRNVSLIMCMYCRSAIANHQLNRFYYCQKDYNRKMRKERKEGIKET
jgi:hypothetical protein